ncbi:hypothetical protein Hanom_Chr07g00581151 [Helianthus anomalus]
MVPIKSKRFLNRYPPSDYAEMKSQPFKLPKITTVVAVHGGFFSSWFSPPFPTHDLYVYLL